MYFHIHCAQTNATPQNMVDLLTRKVVGKEKRKEKKKEQLQGRAAVIKERVNCGFIIQAGKQILVS